MTKNDFTLYDHGDEGFLVIVNTARGEAFATEHLAEPAVNWVNHQMVMRRDYVETFLDQIKNDVMHMTVGSE